jgi:hypothetical protein
VEEREREWRTERGEEGDWKTERGRLTHLRLVIHMMNFVD